MAFPTPVSTQAFAHFPKDASPPFDPTMIVPQYAQSTPQDQKVACLSTASIHDAPLPFDPFSTVPQYAHSTSRNPQVAAMLPFAQFPYEGPPPSQPHGMLRRLSNAGAPQRRPASHPALKPDSPGSRVKITTFRTLWQSLTLSIPHRVERFQLARTRHAIHHPGRRKPYCGTSLPRETSPSTSFAVPQGSFRSMGWSNRCDYRSYAQNDHGSQG